MNYELNWLDGETVGRLEGNFQLIIVPTCAEMTILLIIFRDCCGRHAFNSYVRYKSLFYIYRSDCQTAFGSVIGPGRNSTAILGFAQLVNGDFTVVQTTG